MKAALVRCGPGAYESQEFGVKNSRKMAAAGVAAIVGAASLIAYQVYEGSAPASAGEAAQGVVNPDPAIAGMTSERVPELSTRRFEPIPSMGVGSYTEPAARANTVQKTDGSPPNDAAARGR
jgi:hypothetical protein